MKIESHSFKHLPFPKLFKNYIDQEKKLLGFYGTNPFSAADVKNKITGYTYPGSRDELGDFLREYNARFGAFPQVEKSIKKMEAENALAVVTGQQLTVFGGPLFTIYKIITAIKKAKEFEALYNRPVVPVFWMADEDHDYEEAAVFHLPTRDETEKFLYEREEAAEARVYDISFKEKMQPFVDAVKLSQPKTDFTAELWTLLQDGYKAGETFGLAFGKLVLNLFAEHGIILCGSNNARAKKMAKHIFIESVKKRDALFDSITLQTKKIEEAGYSGQVQVQKSNLFIMDENGNRNKLSFEDNLWKDEVSGAQYTDEQLLAEIETSPEKFSPNVFLRPLLQSALLPDAAYVAGPGEIAYHAQLKPFYTEFGLDMPLIIPRLSATIVETSVERNLQKLPFKLAEYNQRIEDLESLYLERSDSPDIEEIFRIWSEKVDAASEISIAEISEIDPTLQGAAEKAKSQFLNELNRVRGKVYRSVKDQEKTQISRISKVQNSLFPNRNLQEREIAFIYFMNKYGLNLWDDLLHSLNDFSVDSHKIIYL